MIDQLMAPDVALSANDKQKIEQKVAKLDKLLTHWDDDTVWIRVALRASQKNSGVHALLTVGIPGATLVTEEDGDTAVTAVGIAVDEMERELRKRKTRFEQKRRGPGVGETLAAEVETEEEETEEEDYAPPAEPR
jgi:ribosomal subunit interface protein